MTSSLVGSEMCIRDSVSAGRMEGSSTSSSSPGHSGRSCRTRGLTDARPPAMCPTLPTRPL
eukprot:12109235-Prorocentrum_lima.AAC.1